jgi:Na+/proline symporter
MSTIGTHLNLGASYLVNDIYGRFLKPNATEKHYVTVSRIATIFVALLSAGATWYMLDHGASIASAWKFLLALGAGAGLVFILRWYWWRINAWSEIAAMTAAATISLTLESTYGLPIVRALQHLDSGLPLAPLNSDDPHAFAWLMLITTTLTTLIWLSVTLVTKPEPRVTLQGFYDRVRPAALGWRPFAPAGLRENTLAYNFFHWILAATMVYLFLFGFGNIFFMRFALGLGMVAAAIAALCLLFWSLNRQGWQSFR